MQHTRRRGRSTASYIRMMLAIVIVFAISCAVTTICINTASQRAAQLTSERFKMSQRIDALKDELSYVRSDAYVERVARDEFGLILPGEIRYVTN